MIAVDEGLGSALRRATKAKTTLGAVGTAVAGIGIAAGIGQAYWPGPGAVIGGVGATANLISAMRSKKRRMSEETVRQIFELGLTDLTEARRARGKSLLGKFFKSAVKSSAKKAVKSAMTPKSNKPSMQSSDNETSNHPFTSDSAYERVKRHFHKPERAAKVDSYYARIAKHTPEKLQQHSVDMIARQKQYSADLDAWHKKRKDGWKDQMNDSGKVKVTEGFLSKASKFIHAKSRKQAVYDKATVVHKKAVKPIDKLNQMSYNAKMRGDNKKSELYWKMGTTEIKRIGPRVKSIEKRMAAVKGGNMWMANSPEKPSDLKYMKGTK